MPTKGRRASSAAATNRRRYTIRLEQPLRLKGATAVIADVHVPLTDWDLVDAALEQYKSLGLKYLPSGMPDSGRPVFPMRDGRFWTDSAYRNWRARVFQPAAEAVGVEAPRPDDLRHSLASLLFAEGRNPAEIAEELGHSLQVLLGTYVGVIEELRGKPRQSAEELIRAARGPILDRSAPANGEP